MDSPTPCERPEYTIDFTESSYGRKAWSNPKRTSHRVYIHRFEDKQRIECGYVDLVSKKYIPPATDRVHADFGLGFIEVDENSVATITINDEIMYIGHGSLPLQPDEESNETETTAESKVEHKKSSANLQILEHIASISQSESKVTIHYANTIEIKTRQNGFIQSQYPKFSLSVELDGGNTMPKLVEAANAVVDVVEEMLAEITTTIKNR